ncbi:hypothetical protein [Halothiobacillus diazotrophicus]|uniref:hypothetical protein n=1 Tax=Halothiobacillus diazotrophicus TaxID=1860122 RepID=UPI0012E96DB1|nr:hypothetical protein [Halothiobacillus diazotrophicus]
MPHEHIEKLARKMRAAIEALPREALPTPMSSFPAGSCGDASLLLGAYFKDSGVLGFEYICGDRGSQQDNTWTSHAWLSNGPLIVDITADQFEDAPAKIIVSEHSLWHATFTTEKGQNSDFRAWSGPGTYHLHTMYQVLRPSLFGAEPK